MRISDWSQTCALPIYIDKDYDNFGAQSYTDWFPGINLRYDAGDDLVLRGAVTRAIGRPNYAQLAPTIVVNISDNEVEMGNPNLSPLTARSEEHTSELQSLMRISYAVFCLKNKRNQNSTTVSRLTPDHREI